MSQNAIAPLNPATTSGSDLATKLVNNENSVLTQYSGSSRPSYAQAGTLWLDTTTTPWLWKLYDGVSDISIFAFSATSHRLREPAGETSLASAATTDVLGAATSFVAISGSSTITSFGSEPNQIKFVRATAIFTIQHNASSLVLPTAANITTAIGDTWIVISNAAGNVRVMAYQRETGQALSAPVVASFPSGTLMLFFQTSAPTGWTKDTSNYNDHAIRITTGTPTTGGNLNFSTVFGYTATQSYVLTTTDLPAHTHDFGTLAGTTNTTGAHNHDYIRPDLDQNITTGSHSSNKAGTEQSTNTSSDGNHSHTVSITSGATGSTGTDGGHSHNIDMRCRYVDAIRATKD